MKTIADLVAQMLLLSVTWYSGPPLDIQRLSNNHFLRHFFQMTEVDGDYPSHV